MMKVKVYRVLGGIVSIYGVIGYVAYVIIKVVERGTFPAIIAALFMFAFNIFLWAGLILLWRADKNENPNRKSKWSKVINVYVLFSIMAIAVALAFPFFVQLVRSWLS